MKITFENTKTLVSSISIGKSYLIKIIEKYKNNNRDILRELDYLIFSIGDKKNVDSFNLHKDLRCLFEDEDTYNNLAEDLNRYLINYDDFGFCFMHHARNIIRKLDKLTNRLNGKSNIHNFFKLEPKEPDDYSNVSDINTTYNSFISKLYLEKYNKYVDEKDNGAGAWTFQLSTTYLLVIDRLYRLLKPFINDAAEFFFDCVVILNPIITGFTYKTELVSNIKPLEIIYELMQLSSSGGHMTIKKNTDYSEVEFTYTTENGGFISSELQARKRQFRHDKSGKRKIKLQIKGSNNRLLLKIDIVGLQSIQDLTGLACNPKLFSLNTFEPELDAITYNILAVILSNTKEFQNNLLEFNEMAESLIKSNKVSLVFDNKNLKNYLVEGFLRKEAFKNLNHETLLRPLMLLQEQMHMDRYNVIYYRYVASGINMANSEISEMLKPLGSKQQAEIRKMIDFVKSLKYQGVPALHKLFKKVTYRG